MSLRMSTFDIQGLAFGILVTSLGVLFLKSAGLITGQTAGIALLLSYVLPLDFGPIFFAIGVPFLILGWIKRGAAFALRTLIAVLGISVVSTVLGQFVVFERLGAPIAALLGGACSGMGLIALFRHQASAGGMTILGLLVEQKTGLKAGWFQLGVDALVFLSAAFVLDIHALMYSFLGALITNMAIVWNFDVAQSQTGRPGYGRRSVHDP